MKKALSQTTTLHGRYHHDADAYCSQEGTADSIAWADHVEQAVYAYLDSHDLVWSAYTSEIIGSIDLDHDTVVSVLDGIDEVAEAAGLAYCNSV